MILLIYFLEFSLSIHASAWIPMAASQVVAASRCLVMVSLPNLHAGELCIVRSLSEGVWLYTLERTMVCSLYVQLKLD